MITNSRASLKEPRDIGKKHPGKTYLPRFLDNSDLSTLKASVDQELADISLQLEVERQNVSKIVPGSEFMGTWDACTKEYPKSENNATWDVLVTCGTSVDFDGKTWYAGHQLLYIASTDTYIQRTNPGSDGIKTEVEELKVEVDNAKASIQENKTAIAETNFAFAEADKKIQAEVDANKSSIQHTDTVVADLSTTLASTETRLQSEIDGNKAGISNAMSTIATVKDGVTNLESKWTVQADVNGKISGIEMVNNGLKSNFTILTDTFVVTDGSSNVQPFTIEGGKTTMNNAIVRGHLEATSGSFTGGIVSSTIRGGDLNINNNAIIYGDGSAVFNNINATGYINATSGNFSGSLNIQDQGGNVGMKINNQNILIYDQNGVLRVRIGRL